MADAILLENGDDLLLESSDRLLLQAGGVPVSSGDIQWVVYLVPGWACELTAKWRTDTADDKWQVGAPNL